VMAPWTLATLKQRREEILAIASRHGARNIRVFGSVARGDATKDSDVDIVVALDPGRSLFDLGGLVMDLQDALGCRVDVVSERGMRDRLRRRVETEGVAL
jgi:uncharacterized protein